MTATHDATTRQHRRRHGEGGSTLDPKQGGLLVRWTVLGAACVFLCGAAWRYADARWVVTEQTSKEQSRRVADLTVRCTVLEQQYLAAQRQADERQSTILAQLAQIQTQLAEIQADLRRGGKQ